MPVMKPNPTHDPPSEKSGEAVVEEDQDEILHGDWLTVRRKKLSGKGKGKILTPNSAGMIVKLGQVAIGKLPIMQGIGSLNLLAFPPTPTSLGQSRGKSKNNNNGKKRARKDALLGQQGSKDRGKPMQNATNDHVQLNTEWTQPNSELTRDNMKNNSTLNDSSTRSRKAIQKPVQGEFARMPGFDLGEGIIISGNLVRGTLHEPKEGRSLKAKPPDVLAAVKPSTSISAVGAFKPAAKEDHQVMIMDEGVADATVAVSSMILDSRQ
ncbi:hypothetical protein RIF29_38313 [Crotalaria pallida]|uniref:Uncharacterized protein n=1 Tax=Crotalaria pallida TaxID=3830 RepID=A0AAN9DYZ2_CROPI